MILRVSPISAVLTIDLDTFSKMDPYVIITLGKQKFQTKADNEAGKYPKWDETYDFNMKGNQNALFNIRVWDKDLIFDDFVGEAQVYASQWIKKPNQIVNAQIKLRRKGNEVGVININYIYITFDNKPTKQQKEIQKRQIEAHQKKVEQLVQNQMNNLIINIQKKQSNTKKTQPKQQAKISQIKVEQSAKNQNIIEQVPIEKNQPPQKQQDIINNQLIAEKIQEITLSYKQQVIIKNQDQPIYQQKQSIKEQVITYLKQKTFENQQKQQAKEQVITYQKQQTFENQQNIIQYKQQIVIQYKQQPIYQQKQQINEQKKLQQVITQYNEEVINRQIQQQILQQNINEKIQQIISQHNKQLIKPNQQLIVEYTQQPIHQEKQQVIIQNKQQILETKNQENVELPITYDNTTNNQVLQFLELKYQLQSKKQINEQPNSTVNNTSSQFLDSDKKIEYLEPITEKIKQNTQSLQQNLWVNTVEQAHLTKNAPNLENHQSSEWQKEFKAQIIQNQPETKIYEKTTLQNHESNQWLSQLKKSVNQKKPENQQSLWDKKLFE